jgi:hypothetical protein
LQNIAKKPLSFQSPDLFRGKSYRIRETYRNAEEEEQNPNLKRYWFEVNGEKEFSSEQYFSALIVLKKMMKGIDKLQFTTHLPIVSDNSIEPHEFEERVNEFLTENKEAVESYKSQLVMLQGIISGIKTIIIAHKAVSTGNYCPILTVHFK